MKTPKQTPVSHARDREVRRLRIAPVREKIRGMRSRAKGWDRFIRRLATEPLAKPTGARGALLNPALDVQKALAEWHTAGDVLIALLNDTMSPQSEVEAAYRRFGGFRSRFWVANAAFMEHQLAWRLRVEDWGKKWPVNQYGRLVHIGDPAADEHAPEWMSDKRREMFWAAREGFHDIEDQRRRYVWLEAKLMSYLEHDGASARALAKDVAAHVCAMKPVFDAAFRTLHLLRDADTPDELLSSRWPADTLPIFEQFGRDSETIGRRIDDWIKRHPGLGPV